MTYIYAPYLPKGKTDRRDWLVNFNAVLPQYAATFIISQAQLDELALRLEWLDYGLTLQALGATFAKSLTAFSDDLDSDETPNETDVPQWAPTAAPANLSQTGTFEWVIALVASQILGKDGLSPAIQTALRLDPIVPTNVVEPLIKSLTALPGGVVDLNFSKGAAKQVIIESRRAGGAWELLKEVVGTHWSDTRPNLTPGVSESREYRTRFSDGTNGYGNYSPVQTVSTQG